MVVIIGAGEWIKGGLAGTPFGGSCRTALEADYLETVIGKQL
jgi:hypothetical protein